MLLLLLLLPLLPRLNELSGKANLSVPIDQLTINWQWKEGSTGGQMGPAIHATEVAAPLSFGPDTLRVSSSDATSRPCCACTLPASR